MKLPSLNYFILVNSSDAIKEAIIYGELNISGVNINDFNIIQPGDILLFYCLEPVNGIVGFSTVKNKKYINGSPSIIQFSRNYFLPSLLWENENIIIEEVTRIEKGIILLNDKEEIDKISKVLHTKWGAELKSEINNPLLEFPLYLNNKCLECGKELESRIAKYCDDCRQRVKKRQSIEWNKKNIDKIKEAGRKWRLNNPDKLKEYRKRWMDAHKDKIIGKRKRFKEFYPDKVKISLEKRREKRKLFKNLHVNAEQNISLNKSMSDWCKILRKKAAHLSWMHRNNKREEKIYEIENLYNCCWEDKFKELFEKYKHEEAAKLLNLNYFTLLIWAKHLKLQRVCIYCHNKLAIVEGTFHPECEKRFKVSQQGFGIKELLSLIEPNINIRTLNFNDEIISEVSHNILSMLPRKEAIIIERRYLYYNKRQTLEELGSILKVTRERVRQIEKKAIERLSHPAKRKVIREMLRNLIFRESETIDKTLFKKINKAQLELNKSAQKFTITPDRVNNISLSEIELSTRALNCMKNANIKTIGEIASKTESELLSLKNLGKKTFWELKQVLNSFGIKLKN